MKILVLNGPNLNLLGIREEDIYGSESLEEIELKLKKIAEESECELNFFQSNAEHELIEAIHDAYNLILIGLYLILLDIRILVSHLEMLS